MIENAPLLSAVAVPKEEEPLKRVTVEPASAVPVIVGVELLLIAAEIIIGAEEGAFESTVIDKAEEAEEVLSAESVAVAVNE